jgi:hypothetical protein
MLVAADKDLTRDRVLITRNAVSEQVLDQQVAKVEQLKAAIAAACGSFSGCARSRLASGYNPASLAISALVRRFGL